MTRSQDLIRDIQNSGHRKEEIAAQMGISLNTLNNKLTNRTSFTVQEALQLSKILEYSRDRMFDVFYAAEVGILPTLERKDA